MQASQTAAANTNPAPTFTLPPQPNIIRNCEQIAREPSLPPTSKLLVMVAALERRGKISTSEKDTLKVMVLRDQPLLYSALAAFDADMDEDELIDSFKRIALNNPPSRRLDGGGSSVAGTAQLGAAFLTAPMAMAPAPVASSSPALLPASDSGKVQDQLREESWRQVLGGELTKPYWNGLNNFLSDQKKKKLVYFPPDNEIFNAFHLCPFNNIKVVILGQDPYHAPGQAHGLCFSVPHGVPPPPSLVNIYKYVACLDSFVV
jgi:hypothetical protein